MNVGNHSQRTRLAMSDASSGSKINEKPSFSSDQAAEQLTRGGFKFYDRNQDGKIEISVRIDPSYSAGQKASILNALQCWQDVINVTFKEGTQAADGSIDIVNDPNSSGGVTRLPNYYYPNVKMTIGTKYASHTPKAGDGFSYIAAHELGHALGLRHPGDYNSHDGGYEKNAEYAQDTKARSAMSYWAETHQPGHRFDWKLPSGPMLDDIRAVQGNYGSNNNTRSSDTVYGFNSNTDRPSMSLQSANDAPVFSIWDGGGNDTLDLSGFSQSQVINLNAESFSDVGGLKGNVSIAKGVVLENAMGGYGDDHLIGNHVGNRIKGGGGADKLLGGGGADVFVYDHASDSTLERPDELLDFETGTDKIDLAGVLHKAQLASATVVERFSGRRGEIVLSYNHQDAQASLSLDLTGNGKADVLIKAKGIIRAGDLLVGGPDKRTIKPQPQPQPKPEPPKPKPVSDDTVYGFNSNTGDSNTSLGAHSKAPWFSVRDQSGNDTFDFSGFRHNQTIDLRPGTASSVGGQALNVTIDRDVIIENAIGGFGNDLLIGNSADNVLKGGGRGDSLWGIGGRNTFAYDNASDSTLQSSDLIMDFVSGRDKIDLRAMAKRSNTTLRWVEAFTGRIGDTVVRLNKQTGRYFVAVDLTGNRCTDFLVRSTRPIKQADIIGVNPQAGEKLN